MIDYQPEPNVYLTDREAEILRQVAEGRRNAEIAASLQISPHTVRNHLANIFLKLGARTRYQAVAIAMRRYQFAA